MKKIVLANIGNRNLKFKGETYFSKTHGSTFREWTKNLLDNFEENKPLLTINILNDLLDSLDGEIEQVILFPSNQVNEEKQDQDTIFEGEILHKLIEERYNLTVDYSRQVTCKVTDNDALLRFYRKELKGIKQNYPSHKLIICDAGGTAQQKSALKIMAEFLLDENEYQVSYVNPNGILEDVPQLEYRRVIQAEQIKKLISFANYTGSYEILGYDNVLKCATSNLLAIKLIGVGSILFEKKWGFLATYLTGINKKQLQNSTLLSRLNKQESLIKNQGFKKLFSEQHLFILGEILSQIDFFWKKELFNQTILSIALFYENYLYFIITKNLGYDLADNFEEENERLKNEAKLHFSNIQVKFGDKPIIDGVPFKILLTKNIKDDANIRFINLIKPYISFGKNYTVPSHRPHVQSINSVRNKIAHTGIVIDSNYRNHNLPYLEGFLKDLFVLFELDSDNFYDCLNSFIVEKL